MQTQLDHIVIGANDLGQGIAYIKDSFGVDMPYGGVHIKMGTHNHLMYLGNDIFLEVIAINPDLKSPETPRWFGLDEPRIRQKLSEKPALLTWVVNTENINDLLLKTQFSFGKALVINRGDLTWYFGLPSNGSLLDGGMLPYVIEWQSDVHPSKNMVDLGCRFQRLEVYHSNPKWCQSVLKSIGAENLIKVHSLPENSNPHLVAYIDTPNGIKKLRS